MRKKILFALLSLLLLPLGVMAQNVTIRANNGSMIASTPTGTSDYDTFFKCGGFATWQHNQLSMALTASDATTLTDYGQLANPANNLFSSGTKVQIGKGYSTYNICYLSLSLPKGYRFTEYTIVFSKPGETTMTYRDNNWPYNHDVVFNDADATSTFGETNSTFSTYTTSADVEREGEAKSIHRKSNTDDDMGNVLYFKLQGPDATRALITFESAEFFFTAEADYAPLTAPGNIQRVSAVDIPFETSKVDYGTISQRTYAGITRPSYSSANVKDLKANFTLYEAGAITDGEDFDGVTGKIIDYKKGSISVENGYYRIGAADAKNPGTEEHIYYIETPSYVMLSDNATKNPVGYRIVGAKIDYMYGQTNEYSEDVHETYNTFYIRYVRNNTTYYMNSSGGATYSTYQRAAWFIDDEGYIRTGANGTTYLTNTNVVQGGSRYTSVTQNKEQAIKLNIDANGYIYYTEEGENYYLLQARVNGTQYFRFVKGQGTTNGATTQNISGGTATVDIVDNIIGTTTQPYTLKVYGKDGTMTGGETQTVNESNRSGSIFIAGMNNDAIKIGVVGTGLIQGTLTLQALDPYIERMEVVCQDQTTPAVRLSQSFTASDFSVSGGVFHFFLPAESENHTVAITFQDLFSKYADETYTGGSNTHTSRFNFVKSDHYNAFGTSNNTIYNDRSEASNAQLTRQSVGIVGTTKFKFNNAADLTNGNGILTEYPFSLENYAAAPNGGSFGVMEFVVTDEDQDKTRYVFTTDETRYNIAPTTAVQHRTYAFYEMEVHVQTSTYEPEVEFVKIYDKSLYSTSNGDKEDAFYGAVVTALDDDGNPGYASTIAIYDKINSLISNASVTNKPASPKNLLYLDFSQLKGVFMMTNDTYPTMQSFAATNADNCLIFLPKGSSAPNNNTAYKMESGGFHAANNIVITDKQPFFSPYDIEVDAANYATYTRQITVDDNGKVTNATVMLPFTINIDANGEHTNPEGSNIPGSNLKFTVNTLGSSEIISKPGGHNYGTAYFSKIDGTKTEANKPYMIKVDETNAQSFGNTISFIATQKGSNIVKTDHGATAVSGYTYTGELITGDATPGVKFRDVDGQTNYVTVNFTNYSSYSGAKFKHNNENIFYFAGNQYVNMHELVNSIDLHVYPFRGVYAYTVNGSSSGSREFPLMRFDISYDEPETIITGIKDNRKSNADLMIRADKGCMTITATKAQEVTIYSVNGACAAKVFMEGGDTQTVSLPSGLYVVNNAKIGVK